MHAFAARRGKAAVLERRRAERQRRDRRARRRAAALRAGRRSGRLSRPFADPAVGAVSGELILTEAPDGATVGRGVGVYWRYEKLIRRARAASTRRWARPAPIYAIRRELFEPIPDDTLLDDVLIPLRHRAPGLPRAVRAGRARLRPRRGQRGGGVRAQGAHDRRQLSSSSCASPGCSTRAGTASGSRRCRTRACASWARCCTRPPSSRARRWRTSRSTPPRWWSRRPSTRLALAGSCHAERAPPQRAPVRALRRLPPQLGDRGGVLAIRHGAPERDVGARSWSSSPGHRGMETAASVTVEAVESASSAH